MCLSNFIIVSFNSQSVLLVAAKILVGQQVVFLEGFGVLVAFFGAILCARESASLDDTPSSGWLNLWGDALGLISSVGGIGYIVLGKALRASMPVLIFMTLNMLLASFLILLYMKLAGLEFSWNRHIDHGVFG
jgi:drug/metabolite transporter (DMT)-like permease